ncbi:MAG: cell envelope biogenesis protein OmpA [Novosphingobium sp. 32-60-15]|uniref:OmpA family protein n=1 Tax=unclassified Novosphingobium TaxID=2644732 RepID=UPI000BDA0FE5|nr:MULTISPECIES: OmpA family protein [unclassified Novosphingobium]OYX64398.1 MAG: cell envelope biogenesis protein OmpA [Novosphingobium sp. 32-60-15]
MSVNTNRQKGLFLLAMVTAAVPAGALAQVQDATDPNIIVNGERLPDVAEMTKGPDIKGVITARSADKIKVTAPDGTSTLIFFNESTKVSASSGLFGGGSGKLGVDSVLNGLPVTVKTLQAGTSLLASQITFKKGDFKTATMIRHGTAQGFAEQTAATEALRGRMADIDKYNVKSTMNVYFDTGKAKLSPEAKAELCQVASTADGMNNALMLVVGYTDAVGSEEYNQVLSEKRAASVINYLQQACRWKPYRMLTPTGMAEADPVADNETYEGKAQNRRVAVNVLVSKGLDGM